MLTHGARPRQLRWYHAGPMLFGDWGTSRLYVLGLAFYYVGHASFWFMLAMSCLMAAVGWAYQVICRLYPDGGGVYSSARERSHTLAVVGALLAVRRLHRHGGALRGRGFSLRPSAERASMGGGGDLADWVFELLRADQSGHGGDGRRGADRRVEPGDRAVRRTVAGRRPHHGGSLQSAGRVGTVHQADPRDFGRRSHRQHDGHHGRARRQDGQEIDLAGAGGNCRAQHGADAGDARLAGERHRHGRPGRGDRSGHHAACAQHDGENSGGVLRGRRVRRRRVARVRPALVVGGEHRDHRAGEHPVHDGRRQRAAPRAHRVEPLGHAGRAVVVGHDPAGGDRVDDFGRGGAGRSVRDRGRGRGGAQSGGVLDQQAAGDGRLRAGADAGNRRDHGGGVDYHRVGEAQRFGVRADDLGTRPERSLGGAASGGDSRVGGEDGSRTG